jgi:arylsulfatase A-like enzyme
MRIFSFLFLLAIALPVTRAFAQRPNIIFILTDDMGYGDLSCYGRTDYSTPNIDKLASQGMKFTNAYSGAPVCTPTRVSFITGRYPARIPIGLFEPLVPQGRDSAYGITPEYPTVATRLANAGYETALVGKWHLGFLPIHYPLKNGYQYFFGMLSGATDYISHRSDGRVDDLHEMDSIVHRKGYLTDLLAEKAVEYIKREHAKPFFLTMNFNAPHWPWQQKGDQPYSENVSMQTGGSADTYKAMMQSLDEAVGRIMQALEEAGHAKNTIVIFTNDNGGERYSNQAGLAGKKLSLWEGGIKVPAFVRWPEKIRAGSTTDQLAITMDWTATILAAGNAKLKKGEIDGMDMLPVLTAKTKATDRSLYWRLAQRAHQKAMRDGKWKYLQDEKGEYLFDLSTDKSESSNLKDKFPDIFSSLQKKYQAWEKTLLDPLPLLDVKRK